jgi:hypothetical protein
MTYLSEEDKKEQELFGRIKCINCSFYNKNGICLKTLVRFYTVPTPERYRRCKEYKQKTREE